MNERIEEGGMRLHPTPRKPHVPQSLWEPELIPVPTGVRRAQHDKVSIEPSRGQDVPLREQKPGTTWPELRQAPCSAGRVTVQS
jgi:hypothetical protein